jgi:hypothetical protein
MWTGESAFMVALAVVAFRDGGVAAVGLVTAVRMATAALLTPFLATTADRVRREVVLIAIGIVRALALAGTAVVTYADGPPRRPTAARPSRQWPGAVPACALCPAPSPGEVPA